MYWPFLAIAPTTLLQVYCSHYATPTALLKATLSPSNLVAVYGGVQICCMQTWCACIVLINQFFGPFNGQQPCRVQKSSNAYKVQPVLSCGVSVLHPDWTLLVDLFQLTFMFLSTSFSGTHTEHKSRSTFMHFLASSQLHLFIQALIGHWMWNTSLLCRKHVSVDLFPPLSTPNMI
ncbi:hypothetical protein K439DRAFT_1619984 [Ramaria rubella]|nr:hypothetical protein K439DRAFT_1619984 [Ramaria rubella]